MMTVIDIIFIYFYQSSSMMSSRLSLKSSSLSNAGEKRTMIIQRDSLNNLFKTHREMKSSLQNKLTEDIRVENEDIVNIQRHEKLI